MASLAEARAEISDGMAIDAIDADERDDDEQLDQREARCSGRLATGWRTV